ncbi:hypothetical protein SAMN05660691_04117 [Rheinheimera pacifica]|uniref:Lipoprotein n=1 Tax=Rheinheimera pacifica TaxID=173990 RepID=A0A1H6NET2_9GAMM|nr:hypothetical protein [Rheinheimera pacifica]SEI13681.1 hypothetical protein SAMN05660691_04117 [Rheinheimera pacifica]|tara:strand:+ start:5520 stop:5894 length:375 start_codon:yes stop_codon:yes gene_type:complete
MNKNLALFYIFFVVTLSSCSFVDGEIKSFLKCGLAANQLGEHQAVEMISSKMKAYVNEEKIEGSARYVMELGQEVRDELDLYSKGLERQEYTLAKIYNSSKCLDMHEQEKIDMPFKYYLVYIFL